MSYEKVILISIRPEHAKNILNGKKTLELRKSVPKGFVGWVYVYVTKGVGKSKYHHLYNLTEYNNGKTLFSITQHNKYSLVPDGFLNGKVVFRFWFDEYEVLDIQKTVRTDSDSSITFANGKTHRTVVKFVKSYIYSNPPEACVSDLDLANYGKGTDLYAWHIKKLEVFDEPMNLDEFYKDFDTMDTDSNGNYVGWYEIGINPLQRPPQSWQYAWRKENSNAI